MKPGSENKMVEAEGKTAKEGGQGVNEQKIGHGVEVPEGKVLFSSVLRL